MVLQLTFFNILQLTFFNSPCLIELPKYSINLSFHHHHSSLEDKSGGFLFLDTTKFLFHAYFFTAIFHIYVASSAYSPGRRRDEICFLYFLVGAHGWRDGLNLVSYKKKRLIGSSVTLQYSDLWAWAAARESFLGLENAAHARPMQTCTLNHGINVRP